MLDKHHTFFWILVFISLSSCVGTGDNQYRRWSDEKRADIHISLGMEYLKNDQYATAGQEFDYALEISPKSSGAHHGKALLYAELGGVENAREYFQHAIDLSNNNFLVINDYGIYLCEQGEPQSGIQKLDSILTNVANIHSTITRLGLGLCYFKDRQYAKAEPFLRQVLQVDPQLYQALYPMAEIAFQRQQYVSSRGFIERYFTVRKSSPESLFLAFRIEKKLHNDEKANTYQRLLITQYPSSPLIEKLTRTSDF